MGRQVSRKQADKALKAAFKPYKDKSPVLVAIERIEDQARAFLKAEGYPCDLDELLRDWAETTVGRHADRNVNIVDNRVLSRRGTLLLRVLQHADLVRQAIERQDPEAAANTAIHMMRAAWQADLALDAASRGRRDRRPAGILEAIQMEVEEHGHKGAAWLWRHFRRGHTEPIQIDGRTFRGEVYFCEDTEKIVQIPSASSDGRHGRQREIGVKRFEAYFNELFPAAK